MRASLPSLRHAVGKVYRAAADGVKNFWQKVVPRLDSAGRVPHSWKRGACSARAGLCRAARRLAIASVCFASLEGIAARAPERPRAPSPCPGQSSPSGWHRKNPVVSPRALRLRGRRIKEPSMTTDTPTAPHEQLSFTYDDRHWRVRGLEKQLSCERLKVQLLVERRELVHVDTLDLYAAACGRCSSRKRPPNCSWKKPPSSRTWATCSVSWKRGKRPWSAPTCCGTRRNRRR